MAAARNGRGMGQRRIASALVACALLMRLLVPAGWMPSTERGFTIAMCSSMGAAPVWVGFDGRIADHPTKPPRHDQPCTFAAFAAAVVLPDAAAPLDPITATAALLLAPAIAHAAIGRGLAAPPPPPTGPPAQA